MESCYEPGMHNEMFFSFASLIVILNNNTNSFIFLLYVTIDDFYALIFISIAFWTKQQMTFHSHT